MDILLDTQILLWLISGDKRLSQRHSSVFLDPDNTMFFSTAGYWQITIKVSIGKLELANQWSKIIDREMRKNFIKWLPIKREHCDCVAGLPFCHRDPFDRMLVAQAKVEQMAVLSANSLLEKYGIEIIR